jgi:hypothetical protein
MANLPKQNAPLLEQVDDLRRERQSDQADQQGYRDDLERPTLKAKITDVSDYTTSAAYARFGRQCAVNVPPGFEVKLQVKMAIDMNVVTASAATSRVWTFKLVRSDDTDTILDKDQASIYLNDTGSHYSSVILTATDRPPTNKPARYEVMAYQNNAANAKIRCQEQYWEVTPRKAKMGKQSELSLTGAPPAAPTNCTASVVSSTAITVSWTTSSGATSYKVYRGTTSGVYSLIASGQTGASYADSGLAPGTAYYYVVKASNDEGDSVYSNEATATTNTFDGYIYAVGGYNTGVLATNDQFNHSNNTWTNKTALTAARYAPMGFRLVTKVYIVGGDSTGGNVLVGTTYAWDHVSAAWSTISATMPTSKAQAHGAAVGTDKGYAPGGYAGSASTENPEFSHSGATWTTKTAMTAAKYGHGAASIATTMYVAMGITGSTATNSIFAYSQSGDSWAAKTSTGATARYGVGQCSIGSNTLYVMGGFASATYYATNQEYSVSGDSWSNKTDITRTAASATRYQGGLACADSNKAIFAGGTNGTIRDTAQEYSQSGNSWTDRGTLTTARYGLSCVGY